MRHPFLGRAVSTRGCVPFFLNCCSASTWFGLGFLADYLITILNQVLPSCHMEEEILEEGRLYATFERHGEFADAQARLLALDLTETTTAEQEREEAALFRRLSDIVCARVRHSPHTAAKCRAAR